VIVVYHIYRLNPCNNNNNNRIIIQVIQWIGLEVGITILGLSRVINDVVDSLDLGRKIRKRIVRRKRYVDFFMTIVGCDHGVEWLLPI
jgi:hypothetical protein